MFSKFKNQAGRPLAAAAFFALSITLGQAGAQNFSAPSCGNSSSDSTCFTAPTPSNCDLPDASISERGACPVGYVGMMDKRGSRNSCTGEVHLGAGTDESGCTNCGSALSGQEALNIQRAVYEVGEQVNLAFVEHLCPGFSCKDGAQLRDPVTSTVIGRSFRNHVWVDVDGFSSGQLPTSNRVKYLSESGKLPANLPAFAFLPKDKNGQSSTSLGQLYLSAKAGAEASGATSCSGDGKNGCSLSCSEAAGGWQSKFCSVKTVQHWSCSDSYAVNSGGSWQPTRDATVPFTSTAPQDYTKKTWSWPAIFNWNDPAMGNAGGAVYMCNSTINACNGWVTQRATYKCRVPATYDCSYSGADADGRPISVSGSCETCSVEMGAKWDFELAQANDCPATPMSTRAASDRIVWQADLAATSCPINGGGTAPSVMACSGGQRLDATGSACVCAPGHSWNGSTCLPPPQPGTPPSATFSPLSLSKGIGYSGVPMGSLASGAQITALGLAPGTPGYAFPAGMWPHFSGSLALMSGTPSANGSYSFSLKADYASGIDSAGNKYPAGSVTGAMSVTVTGCDASGISWTGGANTCSGTVGNSARVGVSTTISSTSGVPANATGANALSCNMAGGAWTSTSSSCTAPAACPPSGVEPFCNGSWTPASNGVITWLYGYYNYGEAPACSRWYGIEGQQLYFASNKPANWQTTNGCPAPFGGQKPMEPPPPVTGGCDTAYGNKPLGSELSMCDINGGGGPYPSGQSYMCAKTGWELYRNGNPSQLDFCQ